MTVPKMMLSKKLIQLGGEYEKSSLPRRIEIEKELKVLRQENPEIWITLFVVRGQNVIRRIRKQEKIYV